MKSLIFLLPTATMILLSGCVSRATVDYDREAVSKMATYQCFAIDDREVRSDYQDVVLSPIVDRRIEGAIETTLRNKGFNSECAEPDFRVTFNTITKTRTQIEDLRVAPTPFRRYPYYGYGDFSPLKIDQYEEGTFIIDVIDNTNKELVWRGVHVQRLGWSAPKDAEVLEMVTQLLADFPPEKISTK